MLSYFAQVPYSAKASIFEEESCDQLQELRNALKQPIDISQQCLYDSSAEIKELADKAAIAVANRVGRQGDYKSWIKTLAEDFASFKDS